MASYDTSMIWLYLMEHNASDTSTSSPGVDFIRRFLEKTQGPTFPPNEARLVNKLNELLADEGTTLDSEMKRFAYANLVRSFDNLDEWLTSPRKFAPGTKMTFAGLSDPQDRADVILYLNQHGSNLPLPAPPPPEAAGGDNAGAAAENGGAANETGAQENAVEMNVPPAKVGQQPSPEQ